MRSGLALETCSSHVFNHVSVGANEWHDALPCARPRRQGAKPCSNSTASVRPIHSCGGIGASDRKQRNRAPARRPAFGGIRLYFGCATVRRYGLCVLKPCGYFFLASSSETEVGMITSWPGFQFTGVATACLAFSCSESSRRRTSSKFRPALIG